MYCRSVGGLNEESKALVAIRDEISFSPGCCRCCCVGPLTLILVDWRQERCWKTIPTSKGLYCRSVGGSNEESKALVAIRVEISFSPGCCQRGISAEGVVLVSGLVLFRECKAGLTVAYANVGPQNEGWRHNW